ncbi:hypothetical protein [Cysteiniphilum sp. 19S12-1]
MKVKILAHQKSSIRYRCFCIDLLNSLLTHFAMRDCKVVCDGLKM